MEKTRMVVVSEYKLSRRDGKFTHEGKKQTRTRAVVTRDYVEACNADAGNCRFFIIDEDETKQYYIDAEAHREKLRIDKERDKVNAGDIAKAMIEATKGVKPEPTKKAEKVAKYPSGKPNDDWGVNELKGWLDDSEKEYDNRLGRAKLLLLCKEILKGEN